MKKLQDIKKIVKYCKHCGGRKNTKECSGYKCWIR